MKDHPCTHDLHEEFQSAYRAQHSTETALLRVKTDIMTEMDIEKAVFVVLLDLSAAFDTVDHQILLDHLSSTFNITGMALKWISSYLSGRYFSVSFSFFFFFFFFFFDFLFYLGVYSSVITCSPMKPRVGMNQTVLTVGMGFHCSYVPTGT